MDNFFKNCPPVMSDGRHFTDWNNASRRNEHVKYINDITRDDDYRMLLQCNANDFINKDWNFYSKNLNCWDNSCIHNYPTKSSHQNFKKQLNDYNNLNNVKHSCNHLSDYRLSSKNNLYSTENKTKN